jgi:hypothetical protein
MTEWTTIRVRQDAKDDAQARKPDDMSWSEWLRREDYEPCVQAEVDTDALEAVIGELETTIPKRTADELETRLR